LLRRDKKVVGVFVRFRARRFISRRSQPNSKQGRAQTTAFTAQLTLSGVLNIAGVVAAPTAARGWSQVSLYRSRALRLGAQSGHAARSARPSACCWRIFSPRERNTKTQGQSDNLQPPQTDRLTVTYINTAANMRCTWHTTQQLAQLLTLLLIC
jgi:hypothetical protein